MAGPCAESGRWTPARHRSGELRRLSKNALDFSADEFCPEGVAVGVEVEFVVPEEFVFGFSFGVEVIGFGGDELHLVVGIADGLHGFVGFLDLWPGFPAAAGWGDGDEENRGVGVLLADGFCDVFVKGGNFVRREVVLVARNVVGDKDNDGAKIMRVGDAFGEYGEVGKFCTAVASLDDGKWRHVAGECVPKPDTGTAHEEDRVGRVLGLFVEFLEFLDRGVPLLLRGFGVFFGNLRVCV